MNTSIKKWIFPLGLVMLLVCPICLSSCGGDDTSSTSSSGDTGDNGGETSTPLTITQQKQLLEQTAREMMGKVSTSEFQNIKTLAKFVNDQYVNNKSFNRDALDDRAKECMDATLTLTESQEASYDYYKMVTQYYHALWTVSNFTGHFTAGSSSWSYEKANDLQFNFKDANGKDCVVKVTTSGNTFKLSGSLLDYKKWAYSYDYSEQTYTKTYSIYTSEIYIPEQVNVSVTEDGNSIISAEVHLAHQGGETIDLSSDVYNVTAKIQINNFVFDLQKAKAQSGAESAVNFVMSKSGEQLISLTATGVVTGTNKNLSHVGECDATVNLLSKVKVTAHCVDGTSVNDYLQKAEAANDLDTFKSLVKLAKDQVTGKMYLNGQSTESATLGIECFEETKYYGKDYLYKPVWVFADDSKVEFSNYFDEGTFQNVTDTANNLWKDFESFFQW